MKKIETKYIVAIIISLILGVSILGYGYMDYSYKKETLEQKIRSEEQEKTEKSLAETQIKEEAEAITKNRDDCLFEANESEKLMWANTCVDRYGIPYNLNDFNKIVDDNETIRYENKKTGIVYSEDFKWTSVYSMSHEEFKNVVNTEVYENCKLPTTIVNYIDEKVKNSKDECFKKYPQ